MIHEMGVYVPLQQPGTVFLGSRSALHVISVHNPAKANVEEARQ